MCVGELSRGGGGCHITSWLDPTWFDESESLNAFGSAEKIVRRDRDGPGKDLSGMGRIFSIFRKKSSGHWKFQHIFTILGEKRLDSQKLQDGMVLSLSLVLPMFTIHICLIPLVSFVFTEGATGYQCREFLKGFSYLMRIRKF